MTTTDALITFDKARASKYDAQWPRLQPLRDSLHLLIRVLLAELPAEARVLCVGVGTGLELLALAEAYPQWTFTAVDPATPMLDVCRQRVQEAGFASRCSFHAGYIDSLPDRGPYDAATSLLVTHFIATEDERHAYFREIAARLRRGGYLIEAPLVAGARPAELELLLGPWRRMLEFSGAPADEVARMLASLESQVSLLPAARIERLIEEAGFEQPATFYQAILIRAWCARRA